MKISNIRTYYFVEGECEKKLVKTLIENNLVIPGQTDVLNPIQESIKPSHLLRLPLKARIILVFDTDKIETSRLQSNLRYLSSQQGKEVLTVPQVSNLEEELIRCTNIRYIRDLVNCPYNSDFKTAFIEEKRLFDKLRSHHFDISTLWSSKPALPFIKIGVQNQSRFIKLL